MRLYSSNENYKLYQGNMLEMLEVIEPETIDSIVTDPPYGLTSITKRFGKENSAECQYGKDGSFQRLSRGFMGKEWDGSGIEYNIETWQKCFTALKPGGYLLAFGGSRTYHRIACAIEDAGFEIRDTIMWLYGSGFPKSMSLSKGLEAREKLGNAGTRNKRKIEQSCDTEEYTLKQTNNGAMGKIIETTRKQYIPDTDLAKQWKGWGTCLKPSFEPIIVARKPFKGSLVDNVIEYGVGGINIDECRVETTEINRKGGATTNGNLGWEPSTKIYNDGRFPANTILTYDETNFDEVCGGFPITTGGKRHNTSKRVEEGTSYYKEKDFIFDRNEFNDSGSASRYFYCAKANKKDRDEGLEEFTTKSHEEINNRKEGSAGATRQYGGGTNPFLSVSSPRKNTHPTVKPTELMQYLIRLVTPNGGTILDPFNGSGSTGKAVMYENKERNKNYQYIGIELTEEYLPIAQARIEYVCNLKQEIKPQISIFDLEV